MLKHTAEYEVIIARLELQIPIVNLTIYGDPELIAKQLLEEYNVKKAKLIPYHKQAKNLLA